MNIFKALDSLFPCGKNRRFGEVVGIHIKLLQGSEESCYDWKRKSWYVNASVNAFHMHRGLVREFMSRDARKFPAETNFRVKRAFAMAILNAYLLNYQLDQQHSDYVIEVKRRPGNETPVVALWWVVDGRVIEWAELVVSSDPLYVQFGRAVDRVALKLALAHSI